MALLSRAAQPVAAASLLLVLALVLALAPSASAQVVLDGEVPDDGSRFFVVPFDVPEGTVEIEVAHDDLSEMNILDWGLDDPNGFRGWGGGNSENAIVSELAASRSYRPGPIPAGEWQLVVGLASVAERPARYHAEVTLRTTATLAPQPERAPYVPASALEVTPRWYAGDFHVHSRESGDALPTLDEIAEFAQSRGLDFVMLSEHNTDSHYTLVVDAQSRHPGFLLMPGIEHTTYAGHANAIGATGYVEHKIGFRGATIEDAIDEFHAQGALYSINHPELDLGALCIGCGWGHDVPASMIDGLEVASGAWSVSGFIFVPPSIERWDAMLATGAHVIAVGGSDDHRGGDPGGSFYSPIGSPTTMVFAEELSEAAIVAGMRAGRTVIKLEGPEDPFVELFAGDAMIGDTVDEPRVTLRARVTAGMGADVVFVHDGERLTFAPVDADPFEATLEVDAPYGDTAARWRVEVWSESHPIAVTSHLYIAPQEGTPPVDAGVADGGASDGGSTGSAGGGGCDCGVGSAGRGGSSGTACAMLALFVVGLRGRARARARARAREVF